MTERIACNLCGSERLDPVYRIPDVLYHPDEWFDVVECTGCGLGFVNPRPAFDEMGRYYPALFYDYFEQPGMGHEARYRVEAAFVESAVPQRGTLLDVGCANGAFPRFMRARGWEVEGVEPSTSARPIEDFQVWRQPFSEIDFGARRYDVVTAWAVLEHVHDPMAYFIKAAGLLKPSGALVFLVTNFDSLSSRALFREDVPRHLYFFTERTVRRYMEKVGLTLERAVFDDSVYQMRPVNWLQWHLYRLMGRKMTFGDIPPNRAEYFAQRGITPGVLSFARYALRHPLATADRLLLPLYERYQRLAGRYGIATYIARKPVG